MMASGMPFAKCGDDGGTQFPYSMMKSA